MPGQHHAAHTIKGVIKMNEIVQVISAVGFPIVAAVACGMFVKWQYEQNAKQVEEIRKEHKEEVSKTTTALENNTIALTKLIDKIGE